MHTEITPNPNSVKWVVECELFKNGRPVALGPGTPSSYSPLGARLLAIDGVGSVLLAEKSITINREPEADWRPLGQAVSEAIREWEKSSEPALGSDYRPPAPEEESEILGRIRRILDEEIAPYVEQDGGEIQLEGFEEGVVKVRLRGACESCPNSAITLKVGIESRLREEIPEVQRVESIS
ncbi:MAG: NifU family protein [Myxococcota bacterium]|nr:NifU family protein [Myxococcota bacterium]